MNLEFKIGTPVFSREGEAGRLKYLVVDPEDKTITGLIVERGKLLHKDVVVPVSWVEKADEQGVVLDAYLPELETMPEYREVEYLAPDPTSPPIAGHPPAETRVWIGPYYGVVRPPSELGMQTERPQVLHRGRLGITEDEVVVRRGQPVFTNDGQRVATLDHVLVDKETHRIKHLVVHRGQWLQRGEDLIVPADAVSVISDQDIRLSLSRDDLNGLARYRPPMDDTQLEGVITRGLQTQPETKGQNLNVQVDRGLVRLFGEVSDAVSSAASSIAKRIQGVIGVEDRTERPRNAGPSGRASSGDDSATGAQITDAFRSPLKEDLSDVRVQVDKGVAHLSGSTRNVAGKALAGQIAGAVPGVRSVVNDIQPDSIVRARVEAALAHDPMTALASIDVIARSGVITLLGRVTSPEVKEAAEQIARSTAGVAAVLNELEVRPPPDDVPAPIPVAIRLPG
ncbi:MAG TPA: BON domain-containing protein [Chloroflexia bacterium]|nr:BON domain-containing protein [Chloroflexia bacterium]